MKETMHNMQYNNRTDTQNNDINKKMQILNQIRTTERVFAQTGTYYSYKKVYFLCTEANPPQLTKCIKSVKQQFLRSNEVRQALPYS